MNSNSQDEQPLVTTRQQPQPQQSLVVDSRFTCNICFESVVDPVVTQCGHLYCWPCLYRWLEPGMLPAERLSLGLPQQFTTNSSGGGGNNNNNSRRVCPVCKSPCSTPTLVPIYVRRDNPNDDEEQKLNTKEDQSNEIGPSETSSSSNQSNNHDNHQLEEEEEVEDMVEVESSSSPITMNSSTMQGIETTTTTTTTGLRRRNVPSRPAASVSPHPLQSTSSPTAATTPIDNMWMTPLSPNGRAASLSHGIMLTLQQATSTSFVPPLHFQNNRQQHQQHQQQTTEIMDNHPNTTEYLSRLLIMLTSFVIFCFLIL